MNSRQLDEEAIFHVAREIAKPEARRQYLDQICAGEQALRERVEALLAVHEKEESFLQSGPAELPATEEQSPLTERPGTSIGRYKLMEQIGEGGMGIVFVAEQERPIRRKVALKVIKPGMDSKAVVATIRSRAAGSGIDGPSLTSPRCSMPGLRTSGRPYFAMELVKGVPLTEYCDRNRLSIRERLGLFVPVCHAIQHAHQKGIIHRDIKPSNVLVTLHDGNPVPKVIDFGVAKALNARLTDKTIYTEHFQVVGTLLYMSPEQAELSGLDIDTRSDIYSLGVLLYELLTGTTPFQQAELDKAGFDEQRRIIREKEPPRASVRISSLGESATTVAEHRKTDAKRLNQLVKGDLDWIVLKSLEKDRTRRYDSVTALAEDVHRHLADEPITARPPSATYRLGKFARRNKMLMVAGAVVAMVVACGLAGTSWFAVKAAVARDDSRAAEHDAQERLVDLQDEAFQRYFYDALFSQSVDEQVLSRAREINLPKGKLEVLRGLEDFFSGRFPRASEHFQKAKPSVAVTALLSWAQLEAGDGDGFVRSVLQQKAMPLRTDEDYLMHAFQYALAPYGSKDAVQRVSRNKAAGPLGIFVAASADVGTAMHRDNLPLLDSAIARLESLNTLYPRNTLVNRRCASTYLIAGRMAAHVENQDRAAEYYRRGLAIANQLPKQWNRWRAGLLAELGEYEMALLGFERSLVRPKWTVGSYAALASMCGQQDRAVKFLETLDQESFYTRMGLGYLYSQDLTRRAEVKRLCDEMESNKTDTDALSTILRILLMAGWNVEVVQQRARQMLPFAEELALRNTVNIRYLAGEVPASELEDQICFLRFYDPALVNFANGKMDEAKRFFELASQQSYVDDNRWWSQYFLKKIAEKERTLESPE